MEKGQKFWNSLSAKYDLSVDKRYRDTYKNTVNYSRKYLKSTDIVFDFACGTGITTIELSGDVQKIIAVDYSEEMIKRAELKARQKGISNIEFSTKSIGVQDFKDESFNAVMAFNIICYVENKKELFERVYKILKPGGIFLSATDCLSEKKSSLLILQSLLSKIGIFPHVDFLKISELKDYFLNSGFKIIEEQNLYDSPPNYFIAAIKPKKGLE